MNLNYISYHGKLGYALLVLAKSVGSKRSVIAPKGKQTIEQFILDQKEFDKQFVKAHLWDARAREEQLTDPSWTAQKLLSTGRTISKEALDHIERALGMDTRGKSIEQIRAEIVKLSADLPKGHALRDVPKQYEDRGQAIAAYTAVRQVIYNLKQKENTMSETTSKEAPAKKGTKKAAASEAPVKASKKAAVAEPAPAKKGGKKAAAEPAPAKASKKAANGAAEAPAKKAKGLPKVSLEGPFKLTGDAVKIKSADELKLHEGSARHKLVSHMISNGSKKPKGFTLDELTAVAGDQTRQALTVGIKLGYIGQ